MKLGRGKSDHLYVDVDGALLIWPTNPGAPQAGEVPKVNDRLVAEIKSWLLLDNKNSLVIWSMGGAAHADMARRLCGFENAICIRKPGLAIDDNLFVWGKRKLDVVLPHEFKVNL